MIIRQSNAGDVDAVSEIYEKILDAESSGVMTGWKKGIYPTRQTALDAHNIGELFVIEVDSTIVAAAIINQKQVREYEMCAWTFPAQPHEVMVLHTLVIDPEKSGKGYATAFLTFYENSARERSCPYLRLDTNEKNTIARRLYKKAGYQEVGVIPCVFNGISGVQLVCMEKKISGC